ncbi:MAG TPA: hypothetical protein VN366_01080, partial [Feifaniaceae bacterium]|nr:hypothetical protein [Feifaniaceae bacterium]
NVPQPRTIDVNFVYKFGTEEVFSETKSVTMNFWDDPETLHSSWPGNENLNNASGSQEVTYNSPSPVTKTITVTGKNKAVSVTFNYVYGGVTHFTETVNAPDGVTYGDEPITLTSSWGGNDNVNGGSGSGEVSYAKPTDTVEITVTPKSATVLVRFVYLYRGTVIDVDEQSVPLTYGEPDKTVTPAAFNVSGYYLLGPVSPVTVSYLTALDPNGALIEVEVQVGRDDDDDDDDDTPPIPLGPGVPGEPGIPLGVPSTGGVGMSILLMALGLAVVAAVAVRSKRSNAR